MIRPVVMNQSRGACCDAVLPVLLRLIQRDERWKDSGWVLFRLTFGRSREPSDITFQTYTVRIHTVPEIYICLGSNRHSTSISPQSKTSHPSPSHGEGGLLPYTHAEPWGYRSPTYSSIPVLPSRFFGVWRRRVPDRLPDPRSPGSIVGNSKAYLLSGCVWTREGRRDGAKEFISALYTVYSNSCVERQIQERSSPTHTLSPASNQNAISHCSSPRCPPKTSNKWLLPRLARRHYSPSPPLSPVYGRLLFWMMMMDHVIMMMDDDGSPVATLSSSRPRARW